MDDIEWTIVNEGQLLDAMVGHKPVGLNKHFQMALICEKFGNSINKDVDPEKIWKHLGTMYNLAALDDQESIPFPNIEKEFALPEDDFGSLMLTKKNNGENDISKSLMETPSRNSKDAAHREVSSSIRDSKKDSEKTKSVMRNRNSNSTKNKTDETPKTYKRPLRGSFKLEEESSNGNMSPTPNKRRRII
ncbi:MRG/MORF4L-binding protein-like [Coccinella septempunctata]|uniref:MRG/MORF4L-binding protein-like n=1 Tax=Coccinella septempunctata TaxID=41139 RepID=UPI001D072A66|nr:MRG/MORF4L-binding protein-like [Coccinella septempunctata]